MKSLRTNMLIQYSVISFVTMIGLVTVVSVVLANGFDQTIELLMAHGAAMASGAMTPDHPHAIPKIAAKFDRLRSEVFVLMGGGFAIFYGILLAIVLRGWRTITRQQAGLSRANKEIRKLIQELDQRVRDRTFELEAINKELESFSYSVSHDLRAPLRAMDGFSRILMEDYGSELSEEGQGHLQRVRDNARQMGRLVDDLLAFSRLGGAQMRKHLLEPGDLVREALTELTGEVENNHAEVSIGDLPECYGDPALLKHVYSNLLSNALKFTSKQENAKIEVGFEQLNGEGTYFVKDNGAGFDMKYADKLFGVFQRLRFLEDYKGTGVGLAIVKRVIQRHGGQIWADTKVAKGATFFFTLGGNSGHD